MEDHPRLDSERMFALDQQAVRVEDTFVDGDLILDLGGGGEGVLGQIRGRQVVALDIRRDELEESPPGPIKIVGDAKALPFLDESFDAATAFFFLMYVPNQDRAVVFAEAFRILKPGAKLHVWDAIIPPRGDRPQQMFVVPVQAEIPGKVILTGYGTRWDGKEMSANSIANLAAEAGFTVLEKTERGETFHLILFRKQAS